GRGLRVVASWSTPPASGSPPTPTSVPPVTAPANPGPSCGTPARGARDGESRRPRRTGRPCRPLRPPRRHGRVLRRGLAAGPARAGGAARRRGRWLAQRGAVGDLRG